MNISDSEWQEMSNEFTKAANNYQKEADELFWSLPYDDRLKVFCAISKLIYEGELKDQGTYRHVLYENFKFGPDAYAAAQHAGFLSIHNAIFDGENVRNYIKDFVTNHVNIANDNLDKQLDEFIAKRFV